MSTDRPLTAEEIALPAPDFFEQTRLGAVGCYLRATVRRLIAEHVAAKDAEIAGLRRSLDIAVREVNATDAAREEWKVRAQRLEASLTIAFDARDAARERAEQAEADAGRLAEVRAIMARFDAGGKAPDILSPHQALDLVARAIASRADGAGQAGGAT